MVICVRIVLPSDELVRVKCGKRDGKVRDLLRVLTAQQSKKSDKREPRVVNGERRSQQQVFPISYSGKTASLVSQEDPNMMDPCELAAWELVLVRTGLALEQELLVREALRDLDILECRQRCIRTWQTRSSTSAIKRTAESTVPQSPQHIRPRRSNSLPTRCEANTSTTICRPEPQKRRLKLSASRDEPLWPPSCSVSRQVSDLIPQSPAPPSEPNVALLRGAMQLLDQLEALEAEVSSLLLFARDADAKGSANFKIDELLPPLLRVYRALFQPKQQIQQQPSTHNSNALTRFPIEDFTQDLSRALKDAATESLRPPIAPVLMRGWVVCAEWGAFWRNSRRDYACLCDDGVLSFFGSERQCSEYLFALTVARNGRATGGSGSDLALLKVNAPQSQIDLTDMNTGWSVRKGDTETSGRCRHAFALFVESRLRLIMDVDSGDEANAWLEAIGAELRQGELLGCVKSSYDACFYRRGSLENPLASNAQANTRPTEFKLPLRWLHAQIERQNGRSARHQRLQCANLNQARKDFRRDCLMINGELFPGAGVDTLLLALTSELRSTLTSTTDRKQEPGAGVGTEAEPSEMVAMRLAKELLVCSARTDGGGDIFDALHLVFPSDRFSICPRASEMEPIAVTISALSPTSSSPLEPVTPVAKITIRMSYWIIPSGTIAEPQELQSSEHELLTEKNTRSSAQQAGNRDENERLEVVGTFQRKLVGDFCKWHEVEGHVNIDFRHTS